MALASFSSPSSHVQSPPGFTPLMTACAIGSITDVSSILVEYSSPSFSLDINASTPDGGDTALHMACGIGDVGIVSLLLAHGADPNARDKMGMTPAHAAVLCSKPRNSIGVLRVLASFGGDLHVADTTNKGFTPLHYCCSVAHSGEKSNQDDEEVIWSIIEAGLLPSSSPSPPSPSSTKSDEELILQRTKGTSQTAVHISAQRGHSVVLHNLLKRLSIASSSSSSSASSSLPRLSILNILALVDSEGNTPLHLAGKSTGLLLPPSLPLRLPHIVCSSYYGFCPFLSKTRSQVLLFSFALFRCKLDSTKKRRLTNSIRHISGQTQVFLSRSLAFLFFFFHC
jgi:ankyrin repeat protein